MTLFMTCNYKEKLTTMVCDTDSNKDKRELECLLMHYNEIAKPHLYLVLSDKMEPVVYDIADKRVTVSDRFGNYMVKL